jgi:hypothetical protein
MWMMILIAVHMNNPKDQPGRIELMFQDQKTCEQVLSTMKYELKFKSFKVEGLCQKQF